MKDTRLAYGAQCTWFGLIKEVGGRGTGPLGPLPCCPLCGGMLFELDTEKKWWDGVDKYEKDGHPGYRAMWVWAKAQEKCFKTLSSLQEAYKKSLI